MSCVKRKIENAADKIAGEAKETAEKIPGNEQSIKKVIMII